MSRVILPVLLAVTALMFLRAPFLIGAAPLESTMGLVQKIFYFHVPSAMVAMLSAVACGVASALYLWRRRPAADHAALAAAELVVVLGAVTLITGPLWARKAWGVWWDWEPRLTLTLVMWMVFATYLLLRRFAGPGSDVMAGAVGLFGAMLVPFVYWSVNIWRTLHPTTEVTRTLPPEMAWPFRFSLLAFLLLWVTLMMVRVRLESSQAALDRAYATLDDQED
jgi:heme exporter protein C